MMRNIIIIRIFPLLILNAFLSEQASFRGNDEKDELLKELLEKLKEFRMKESGHVLDLNKKMEDISSDDEENSYAEQMEIVINNNSEKNETRKKAFNPYRDLEMNLKMDTSHPSNKFYGDDPNVEPCGPFRPQVLSEPEGIILSPGYETNTYGNNLTCSWKLVAPPGEVVELNVMSMDIESNQECRYDLLEVFDVVNRKGISLGKYCGSELPMELLQSTEQHLYLYFITDSTNDVGKFAVKWRMVPPKLDEPSTPSCGRPIIKPNIEERIVNGEQAKPFSWPWMVSIRVFKNGQWEHNCGGSILSEAVIVSAAHCFYDPSNKMMRPLEYMRIVAGEYDEKTTLDGPTQTLAIKTANVHEKYDQFYSSSAYDIAVVILDGKLKFNNHVLPICLPREEPRLTSLCYVTGWGDTDHTGDRTVLNQVRLPLVNHNTCKRADYYGIHMFNNMICAGYEDGGKDACQRDSGGPFVCYNAFNDRWYLHGVASWGIGCALPMRPGVYTRVSSYIDWIYDACGVRQ